ncbi:phosphatidylglycerophosphatase and protein-tyrosine phosphatase 1-like isoform X1 [Portunus trituberculatus]|nr:phosphatidylglycerophosphatase and protein-tyrosine phosphatase 1-like isoform X1 [Portunus trituberculatus]
MTSRPGDMGRSMGWAFARLTFLPTLAFNVAMRRVSARQWYNRVDDRLILGALPFRGMTKELVEVEGVKGVVSMNEDYELMWLANAKKEWESVGVKFLQLSTTDIFEAPSQEKLQRGVEFIQEMESSNESGSVYVHCKAGRTRSATLVACYLMSKYKWNPEKALAHIVAARPHVWLGPQQHRALATFYETVVQS